ENGTEDSRWPSVIAPLSLIFLSVPVSSAADAGAATKLAATTAGTIHFQRMLLSPLDGRGLARPVRPWLSDHRPHRPRPSLAWGWSRLTIEGRRRPLGHGFPLLGTRAQRRR